MMEEWIEEIQKEYRAAHKKGLFGSDFLGKIHSYMPSLFDYIRILESRLEVAEEMAEAFPRLIRFYRDKTHADMQGPRDMASVAEDALKEWEKLK